MEGKYSKIQFQYYNISFELSDTSCYFKSIENKCKIHFQFLNCHILRHMGFRCQESAFWHKLKSISEISHEIRSIYKMRLLLKNIFTLVEFNLIIVKKKRIFFCENNNIYFRSMKKIPIYKKKYIHIYKIIIHKIANFRNRFIFFHCIKHHICIKSILEIP